MNILLYIILFVAAVQFGWIFLAILLCAIIGSMFEDKQTNYA